MSYYYKHKFISPEPLFAKIKEELRAYFDTNMVDDTLFTKHVDFCLGKLGKSAYSIKPLLLEVNEFKATLPEDFKAIREAWMCNTYYESALLPGSTYYKVEHYKIDDRTDREAFCRPCDACEFPDVIEAVYKTSNTVFYRFQKKYLLKPSNIDHCGEDLFCANFNSTSMDSYDIKDNKFVTNFREGKVYILYYSVDYENQLIPDTVEIQNYIELYIKHKIFEQLWHQNTDETYNQSLQKYTHYKQMSDEALIIARIEEKKEDIYRQQRSIKRVRNRNNKFIIR